jgi:hypothetical protein
VLPVYTHAHVEDQRHEQIMELLRYERDLNIPQRGLLRSNSEAIRSNNEANERNMANMEETSRRHGEELEETLRRHGDELETWSIHFEARISMFAARMSTTPSAITPPVSTKAWEVAEHSTLINMPASLPSRPKHSHKDAAGEFIAELQEL